MSIKNDINIMQISCEVVIMRYIGVDIGGTKCAVVLGDERNILEKIRFDTKDVGATLDLIYGAIEQLMPAAAIGVSCGGPLDEKRGIIMSPPNLPGWDEIHITELLSSRFGIPAYLCNDANACALAEWRLGAGQGCENMIFLTFGTGLGAGLILNGRLFSGSNGNAGEAGHIRLAPRGPVGYGKAGSFEGFCSGGGIAQLAKALAEERLLSGCPVAWGEETKQIDNITTKTVAEYAKQGDADALSVFNQSAEMLGRGLAVLIDLFNPERIVIGSVYARCEELFKEGMLRVLSEEALPASLSVCRVVLATLGEQIGDLAALTVATEGFRGENNG